MFGVGLDATHSNASSIFSERCVMSLPQIGDQELDAKVFVHMDLPHTLHISWVALRVHGAGERARETGDDPTTRIIDSWSNKVRGQSSGTPCVTQCHGTGSAAVPQVNKAPSTQSLSLNAS